MNKFRTLYVLLCVDVSPERHWILTVAHSDPMIYYRTLQSCTHVLIINNKLKTQLQWSVSWCVFSKQRFSFIVYCVSDACRIILPLISEKPTQSVRHATNRSLHDRHTGSRFIQHRVDTGVTTRQSSTPSRIKQPRTGLVSVYVVCQTRHRTNRGSFSAV